MNHVLGDLDVLAEAGAEAEEFEVLLDEETDSPTSVPCGITISITLDC